MPNINCLQGIRCPKCGNEDEFLIQALVTVTVTDEGSSDEGCNHEWTDDSFCECGSYECEYTGKLKDFYIDKKPIVPASMRTRLEKMEWVKETFHGPCELWVDPIAIHDAVAMQSGGHIAVSILRGIELEWNEKDGTIEIADDQAKNQNKTRVIAEMHDRDFGERIVDAVNRYSGLTTVNSNLIDKAERLMAAIDGTTSQFADEVYALADAIKWASGVRCSGAEVP